MVAARGRRRVRGLHGGYQRLCFLASFTLGKHLFSRQNRENPAGVTRLTVLANMGLQPLSVSVRVMTVGSWNFMPYGLIMGFSFAVTFRRES